MKCPRCQAKLLPVDGVMFCLQCGNAVAQKKGVDVSAPELEDTTDPILQRAISEATQEPVHFRMPAAPVIVEKTAGPMKSMRSILGPPRELLLAGAGGQVVNMPSVAPVTKPESTKKSPEISTVQPASNEPINAVIPSAVIPVKQVSRKLKFRVSFGQLPAAWLAGAAAFAAFLILNGLIFYGYANKVYPGVKVQGMAVGGTNFNDVPGKLARLTPETAMTVEVGSQKFQVSAGQLGQPDFGRMQREAESIGHATMLPLAGLIEAQFSKPVPLTMTIDNAAVSNLTSVISGQVNRVQSDAVPVVYGGQAFTISEKAGSELDINTAEAQIRSSYGMQKQVALHLDAIQPYISTSAYAADVQDATTELSLALHISLRGVDYAPTPTQIGQWLQFAGPGKGLTVDSNAVAAYVGILPGDFDRDGTTRALVAAMNSKQGITYVPSLKKTVAPSFQQLAQNPVTYRYCLEYNSAVEPGFAQAVQTALTQSPGWTLGGKIAYEKATNSCNFNIQIGTLVSVKALSPLCASLISCESGDNIAISGNDWSKPPSSWKSGITDYQDELITQEVGNWLGFEHASCTVKGQSMPILSAPTVVLSGCSPQWYEIPPEIQGTKAQLPL